ncbi:MAG: acyltransferase [Prolixibacteraceae bacterium]|nr:acyltransferase [Prolixibacteraceae bacterium]
MLKESIKRGGILDIHESVEFGNDSDIHVTKAGALIIKQHVKINDHVQIKSEGELIIGEKTLVGRFSVIACRKRLKIGKNCLIAESVSIRDHDHLFEDKEKMINQQGYVEKDIEIGDNVWIGAKVTILKGVTIGENSIIGANAVVSKSIPRDSIAVGIPAKVIKKR